MVEVVVNVRSSTCDTDNAIEWQWCCTKTGPDRQVHDDKSFACVCCTRLPDEIQFDQPQLTGH